jgi:hypothetical protein
MEDPLTTFRREVTNLSLNRSGSGVGVFAPQYGPRRGLAHAKWAAVATS